ncbi:MAG TPA: hypothetical protein VNN72_01260 [Polyangiaceae bacterium]|nr:hypothetical protein [Polyangiaceae bacterium]
MSPETRDFLAAVRGSEDPNPDDESRVLAAVQATIAGVSTSPATRSVPATRGVVSGTASGLKVLGALLGVFVGAALVASAVAPSPAEPTGVSLPKHAPVANAPGRASAPTLRSTAPPPNASASREVPPPNAPRASRRVTPSTAGEPGARAEPSSSVSLREEIALLAVVQSALERGDGAEALRRLDGHATSDRQFVAERRAARIAALCLLRRVPEARQLAAVFFRENSGSVQRTAVEHSCAATKTNPER